MSALEADLDGDLDDDGQSDLGEAMLDSFEEWAGGGRSYGRRTQPALREHVHQRFETSVWVRLGQAWLGVGGGALGCLLGAWLVGRVVAHGRDWWTDLALILGGALMAGGWCSMLFTAYQLLHELYMERLDAEGVRRQATEITHTTVERPIRTQSGNWKAHPGVGSAPPKPKPSTPAPAPAAGATTLVGINMELNRESAPAAPAPVPHPYTPEQRSAADKLKRDRAREMKENRRNAHFWEWLSRVTHGEPASYSYWLDHKAAPFQDGEYPTRGQLTSWREWLVSEGLALRRGSGETDPLEVTGTWDQAVAAARAT